MMFDLRHASVLPSIDYRGLCSRIESAKSRSGLKRAQSKLSLVGETRTFAEILDAEVEKAVLYYIKQQGNLAGKAWELRSRQLAQLQDFRVSLQTIDDLFEQYRSLTGEILQLLEFLDENVKTLRKIIQKHDSIFDLKLGTIYFDTRIGKKSKNAHLLPLYHQDGIRAIMSTIRRGFEDLYDAKNALEGKGTEVVFSQYSSLTGAHRTIPRISFGNRLASANNLQALGESSLRAAQPARYKSTGNLFSMMRTLSDPPEVQPLERSLSDLEPLLKRTDLAAERVMELQQQTISEVLAANSEMALEVSLDDLPGTPVSETAEPEREREDKLRFSTHLVGLYINLFLTFAYLANQYVVAPTSGEYARLLGMTPAMSGVIIGLCPAAALVSSFLYSMWSNHSFKQPILLCVGCGIVGNILYGMALQCNSSYMLLAGRLITGFGGPRVISRRYIADHVPSERRLVASSQFVTAGALGLAAGPLISSLVERSGLEYRWQVTGLLGTDREVTVWWYQAETAPGWIMAALWLIAGILVIVLFTEPSQQYMRANKMKKNANSSANLAINASAQLHRITESAGSGVEIRNWSEYSQAEMGRDQAHSPINLTPANNNVFNLRGDAVEHAIPEQEVSDRSPLLAFGQRQPFGYNSVLSTAADRSAYRPATTTPGDDYSVGGWWELITAEVVVILVLYIVNKTGQELVISSIPLVTQAEFAWSREGGGYYMAAVGASVLPMILLINRFVRDSEERELVLNLSYACLVCLLVMLHFAVIGEYTVAQYVIGSALLFGFLNTLEGVIMALLARVISPELAKGTFNSGLLATEAGTFGRVVGDVCITVFGAGRHPDAVINQLFSPFLVLLVLSVGLVFYYYDRLL